VRLTERGWIVVAVLAFLLFLLATALLPPA
jgi:hypothetical protein